MNRNSEAKMNKASYLYYKTLIKKSINSLHKNKTMRIGVILKQIKKKIENSKMKRCEWIATILKRKNFWEIFPVEGKFVMSKRFAEYYIKAKSLIWIYLNLSLHRNNK